MSGALLRSGEAREFQALGADGQPVYSAALPLREAIRLKLGTDAANCLALVQPSENGARFDWYAPFAGDVIPWVSASEDERRAALSQLEDLHRQLLDTATRMEQDAGNREKQIFARLLRKAVHFPGSEHVYLVDGKPVVTFWGFAAPNAETVDPLLHLRPPPVAAPSPAPPPAAPAPIAVKKSRWRWLWWLLPLLLLLLLLLFLLRACAPQVNLPFGLSGLDLPGLPALNVDEKLPDVPFAVGGGGLGSGTGLAGGQGALPDDAGNDGALPAAADDAAQTPELPPDAGQPPTPEQPDSANPPAEPPQTPPQQQQPPEPPTNPAQGNPLAIPPDAVKNGSTDFLNGRWKAGAGIQDAQTGQPLRLDYEFNKGKGEVRIQRGDGVECRGPVTADMQGGKLGINGQGQASCSDGSRYSLPQVQCQPGDSGADCQGSYQNQRFPMSMRKNENGK